MLPLIPRRSGLDERECGDSARDDRKHQRGHRRHRDCSRARVYAAGPGACIVSLNILAVVNTGLAGEVLNLHPPIQKAVFSPKATANRATKQVAAELTDRAPVRSVGQVAQLEGQGSWKSIA
jgi:hypothetical protein